MKLEISNGTELDWAMVEKAAQSILKQASDAWYHPPEAVDLHLARVKTVIEAIDSIADALKLSLKDTHEMSTEACTLYNSSKAHADGYDFVICSCSWISSPTKSKDAATIFSTHVLQQVKS